MAGIEWQIGRNGRAALVLTGLLLPSFPVCSHRMMSKKILGAWDCRSREQMNEQIQREGLLCLWIVYMGWEFMPMITHMEEGIRAVSGCLGTDLCPELSTEFLLSLRHSSVRSACTSWKRKGMDGKVP